MGHVRGLFALLLVLAITFAGATPSAATSEGRSEAPAGQMIWGVHISLAPTWFDPLRRRESSRRSWSFTPSTTPC
jgi:hypothetical protein